MDEAVISDEILQEFKERMKIYHNSEDDNLKRLLYSSYLALKNTCGLFELSNEQGKELVFERTRYAYNDSLEFFTDNFLTAILDLSMINNLKTGEDEEGG